MILDGVSLYRQLRHRPGDDFHSGGQIVSACAGQLVAEYLSKTAKLAAWFLRQPSGGSASRGGCAARATRADGYAER
eukprot:8154049-Pyramimonas_sp.AAC.1